MSRYKSPQRKASVSLFRSVFLSDIEIKLFIRSSGISIRRSYGAADAEDTPKPGGAVADPAPSFRYESKLDWVGASKSSEGYSEPPLEAAGFGYCG